MICISNIIQQQIILGSKLYSIEINWEGQRTFAKQELIRTFVLKTQILKYTLKMPFRQRPQFTLKLRNMIIVLMISFIIVMLTVYLATLKISLQNLEYYFKTSSDIIFQYETDRQLQYYLVMYQNRLKQVIRSGNQTLQSIQLLYHEIQAKQTLIHSQTFPEYSLQLQTLNSQNEKQFGILSVSPVDPIESAPLLNLTSLLNEYLFEFGFFDMKTTQYVYYTDVKPEQLYFQYPSDNEEGFIPQEFDQYVEYIENNCSTSIIPPYLYWDGGPIIMSIYNSMFNLDTTLQGVLALDFTFLDFQIHSGAYFLIVNQNGVLLTFNGTYTKSTLPLFNDSEITGFNQSDWDKIINSPQTKIYNSLIKHDVFIQQKHWVDDSFILLTYQDVNPYIVQQDIIMSSLYEFTFELQNLYYLFSFLAVLVSLVFQCLMIYKILEPLTNFTFLLKSQIYLISQNDIKKSFQEQIRVEKLKNQIQIHGLYRIIVQANQQARLSKSKECYIHEQFTFPKKQVKANQFITQSQLQDQIQLPQVEILQLIYEAFLIEII